MTTGRINQVNIFFGVRKHKTRSIKLVAHSTATPPERGITDKHTIRLIRILISLSQTKKDTIKFRDQTLPSSLHNENDTSNDFSSQASLSLSSISFYKTE